MLGAREVESTLLTWCALVAQGAVATANDSREANLCRVASMLLRSRFPAEAARLLQSSGAYFEQHPEEQRLAPVDLVRQRWLVSLPRFRDQLVRVLHHQEF